MRPHFEGTLAINELAHTTLLAPGGFVDELLAGTLDASKRLAAQAVQTYRFDEAMLPSPLRARGVADAAALPNYPYRDDALLYSEHQRLNMWASSAAGVTSSWS